jgi:hypothetical protein
MNLHPQLDKIRAEAEDIDRQAAELCNGLSESELAWRSDPGRWSIAENLQHLRQTTELYIPAVDQSIVGARARNLLSAGPFSPGLFGRLFVWYLEPPPKLKSPAPKVIRPILEGRASDVLPRFLESQQQMVQRLQSASGLDLAAARVISPLSSIVKMNLLAMFMVWTAHSRRHIWQAKRVRHLLSDTLSRLG